MLPPVRDEANRVAPAKFDPHTMFPTRRRIHRMNTRNVTIAAAFAGLLAVGTAQANHHEEKAGAEKVKCYGVAKAGKNDCATATHGCAGAAKTDNDPAEWVKMPKDACEKAGGKVGTDKPSM
jgi:uncharacterized membrane protein